MALAVKSTPEATSTSLFDRLPLAILAGVLYVVGSLAIVGKVLPTLWWEWMGRSSTFVNWALLLTLGTAAAGALFYVGLQLLGPKPQHGLKAGIFAGVLAILGVILVARWASLWFEAWAYRGWFSPLVGEILTGVVGVALLFAAASLFFRKGTTAKLEQFEDQGWFSTNAYKRSQGLLVRRGTIFGVVVIIGCGIFTLLEHKTLETGAKHWQVNIPFTGQVNVTMEGDLGKSVEGKPLFDSFVPPDQQSVRITNSADSILAADQVISIQKFRDEIKSLKDQGKQPPEAVRVIDRFKFRDIRQEFAQTYTKIDYRGDLPTKYDRDMPVLKSEFEDQKAKLKKEAGNELPTDTAVVLPEGSTQYAALTLLPNVKFTVPIALVFLAVWLGWRAVNMPVFADFLIATEAEINKVSWTTAKRLRQDTVVVLSTVILLTIILLILDLSWSTLLSFDFVGVIKKPKDSSDKASVGARPF